MADNIAITAGSGTSVATDDVSGAHYQKVKLAIGAADTANLLSVGAGSIDTGTPRFALADDSAGVTAYGQALKSASLPVVIASDQELAHDAADSTSTPTKIGYRAVAGMSGATLVAAADRANANGDLGGALYVRTHCGLEDIVSGNASNTDGTSTEVIATAGSGVKQYLTRVVLTNMHASSTIYVEMKSGTTVKATIPCPPGGATVAFDPPLPPNAANEAWNFDPSAATTTIYCTAVGFKSKI